MDNVTDRIRNPFGLSPPCEDAPPGEQPALGYGDANADFHLIGDHPGVHGGGGTGVPFAGPEAADLRAVLEAVGLLVDDDPYVPRNLYCSYLYPCPVADRSPTDEEYRRLEPTFDAELRAVAAHVLLPVGDRALGRVLAEYTSRARAVAADADATHAQEVRGRGFLVVPVADPSEWGEADPRRLRDRLRELLASDYRQTADLGRFVATRDSYLVR